MGGGHRLLHVTALFIQYASHIELPFSLAGSLLALAGRDATLGPSLHNGCRTISKVGGRRETQGGKQSLLTV